MPLIYRTAVTQLYEI